MDIETKIKNYKIYKEELEKITKLSIIDVGIFMIESLKSK